VRSRFPTEPQNEPDMPEFDALVPTIYANEGASVKLNGIEESDSLALQPGKLKRRLNF
jgi:hypothetical protein